MKTPMQELLDKINNEEFDHLDDCKMFIQEYMLEKEKERIMHFGWNIAYDAYGEFFAEYFNAGFEGNIRPFDKSDVEQYYNETFNTKER